MPRKSASSPKKNGELLTQKESATIPRRKHAKLKVNTIQPPSTTEKTRNQKLAWPTRKNVPRSPIAPLDQSPLKLQEDGALLSPLSLFSLLTLPKQTRLTLKNRTPSSARAESETGKIVLSVLLSLHQQAKLMILMSWVALLLRLTTTKIRIVQMMTSMMKNLSWSPWSSFLPSPSSRFASAWFAASTTPSVDRVRSPKAPPLTNLIGTTSSSWP